MAKALERFVKGTQDIFSHPTNVDIHNRVVSFDISELPASIQTAGYLVVLDHIMNRLIKTERKVSIHGSILMNSISCLPIHQVLNM